MLNMGETGYLFHQCDGILKIEHEIVHPFIDSLVQFEPCVRFIALHDILKNLPFFLFVTTF